jgi:uncharacterized protein YjbI with pentapeptide repeats
VSSSNIFVNANLDGATVSAASMPGSIFVNPSISQTTFADSSGIAFNKPAAGATFLGADFTAGFTATGFRFDGATFGPWSEQSSTGPTTTVNTTFAGTTLGSSVTFGSTQLSGTVMNGVQFTGTVIDGANFSGVTLSGCQFTGAQIGQDGNAVNFAGTNITQATLFRDATIGQASFQNAYISSADFSLTTFNGGPGDVSFNGAVLGSGVHFASSGGIQNVDFTGAEFDGVTFMNGGTGGLPESFIANLLDSIGSTSSSGVIITNATTGRQETYIKQAGTGNYYMIVQGDSGPEWQELQVDANAGTIEEYGDPVPVGGIPDVGAVDPTPVQGGVKGAVKFGR